MEKTRIFTRSEAANIVESFENILDKYNIHVPSPEDDERDAEEDVGLYGSTYSDLLDEIEDQLINILRTVSNNHNNVEIITDVFGD